VFTALMLVVSTAVALAAAEVVLRVKNSSMKNYDIEMWKYSRTLKFRSPDPALGHEHVRSASAVLQSVTVRTNEWGLRGGPVPAATPDKRRILFLGGSITLGWGTPEEETVTGRLQTMFERDGRAVEVLNAGVGNYNAARYVELFLTRLTGVKPTDIVVHYFLRDAEELDPGGGNVFLRNSQLAVTMWIAANRVFRRSGEGSIEEHYRKVYAPDSPGVAAMQAALRRLATYAREHRIRLYLAMTPDVHNLRDYKFGHVHTLVEKTARDLGFVYIDLYPALAGLRPEAIWAMPGDPHPNSFGHQKMAEAIYPVLADAR
jgi:lysophospholipase L1-like esterase